MTEYWVSQAKHWCEYCRIYINGNKQSIAFHENGRKHKEIVEASLKDMRRRGRERRQENSDLEKELAKIERSAMKDYMAQDVVKDAGPTRPPTKAQVDHAGRLAELEAKISSDRLARARAAAFASDASAQLPAGWSAATNPDGQVYYLHEQTGAVQWEAPITGGSGDSAGAGGAGGGGVGGDGDASGAVGPSHGWQQGWTAEGVPYFFHTGRGVTQWEEPPEWAAAVQPAPQGEVAQAAHTSAGVEDDTAAVGTEASPAAASTAMAAVMESGGDGGGDGASGGERSGPIDRDADEGGDDKSSAVDAATGLGTWATVEPEVMPEGGWDYEQRREKRQRVSWAVSREEVEEEEEADRLDELQARFAVPDDMKAAIARQEAAEAAAAAAAEAAAPVAVFAKRKGGKGGFRKKEASQ